METVTNTRFSRVSDKYTTKYLVRDKEFLNYHKEAKQNFYDLPEIKRIYKSNSLRAFVLKVFIKLLYKITEDVLNGVVVVTPFNSKIYIGSFPKHKSLITLGKLNRFEHYYKDHDWSKSLLINTVVININGIEKYIRIPYKEYKKVVKMDLSKLKVTSKSFWNDEYWEYLLTHFPLLKTKKLLIKRYMIRFFKSLEQEVSKGYSVRVKEYLFYTYRTNREQARWECSHKKLIYRKLKLWKDGRKHVC